MYVISEIPLISNTSFEYSVVYLQTTFLTILITAKITCKMQIFPKYNSPVRGTVVNPSDLDGNNIQTKRSVVLWFRIKSKPL